MPDQSFSKHHIAAGAILLLALADPLAAAPTPEPVPETAKIAIQPHRAIYDMSLASAKNGSNVSSVTGQMLFEWADSCDGWAVQQHLRLNFSYAEGDTADINSTSLSWESKDGQNYRFNVRRLVDGKETELYRGKANLTEKPAGRGVYTTPKGKEITFGPDVIFPSDHTQMILRKAVAGEKFFSRQVFDGSDEEGLADISAFIGKKMEPNSGTEMNPNLKNNALLNAPSWPVRLAFFKADSDTGLSDYEMDLNLLANGVARSMVIDYGDFTIAGVLVGLESLPGSEGCGPTTTASH